MGFSSDSAHVVRRGGALVASLVCRVPNGLRLHTVRTKHPSTPGRISLVWEGSCRLSQPDCRQLLCDCKLVQAAQHPQPRMELHLWDLLSIHQLNCRISPHLPSWEEHAHSLCPHPRSRPLRPRKQSALTPVVSSDQGLSYSCFFGSFLREDIRAYVQKGHRFRCRASSSQRSSSSRTSRTSQSSCCEAAAMITTYPVASQHQPHVHHPHNLRT